MYLSGLWCVRMEPMLVVLQDLSLRSWVGVTLDLGLKNLSAGNRAQISLESFQLLNIGLTYIGSVSGMALEAVEALARHAQEEIECMQKCGLLAVDNLMEIVSIVQDDRIDVMHMLDCNLENGEAQDVYLRLAG